LNPWTQRVGWVDWNVDGVLDIFVATYQDESGGGANVILDGASGYSSETPEELRQSGPFQSFVWSDLDGDNDQDLVLVAEDDIVRIHPNRMGYGFDSMITLDSHVGAQGVAACDWDCDGDQDLVVTYWGLGARLWVNNGELGFSEASEAVFAADGNGQDAVWGDFDNDGWTDLYVTMYQYGGSGGENKLFRNISGERLEPVSEPLLEDNGSTKGAAWIDFDTDGSLDLAINNWSGMNRLWINERDGEGHWLQLELEGDSEGGLSAAVPIGAVVRVTTGDHVQTRELRTTSGYTSGGEDVLHFGVGSASVIDEVYVVWPRRLASGGFNTTTLTDVPADQRLLIQEEFSEQEVVGVETVAPVALAVRNYPNPFNPQTTITYELPAAGEVQLGIYDLRGRTVRTLVDGASMPVGRHDVVWNGRNDAGRQVATGVYFCRVRTESGTAVHRLTLVK
jgi:hypothetical protein